MTAVSPLRVPVLMYHEIADIAETPSRLAVSPSVFADHLAYLSEAGFTTITAGAPPPRCRPAGRGPPPGGPFCLPLATGTETFPPRPYRCVSSTSSPARS